MKTRLQLAAERLDENNYTLYAFCDGCEYHSILRGVAPLLDLHERGITLDGCAVADKVVGKAGAFLHLLVGTEQLYAGVISQPALDLLQANGVYVDCGTVVSRIVNRTNTGLCPMETAVIDATTPTQALQLIKQKLAELKQN